MAAYRGRRMDDETLVEQALAGDSAAVAALYDRYADRLFDYARRLTGNASDANDAVHDSFLVAMQRLGQLRDPSRFRPWMYAIVRTEVGRRRLRVQRLQFGVWDDPVSTDITPTRAAEITELQRLVADAAEGLSDDDREVLDLHLRHGLNGPELAAALAIPERHVSVTMQRVRERLARGLGVVLVGRSPNCPVFAGMRAQEGDELTELARKRLARHIDTCPQCSNDRDERMRPEVLLGALPMALAPVAMRAITLEGGRSALTTAAAAGSGAAAGGGGTAATAATTATTAAGTGGRVIDEAGRHWLQSGFPQLDAARRAVRAWLAVAMGGTAMVAGGAVLVTRDEATPAARTTVAVTTLTTVTTAVDSTDTTVGSNEKPVIVTTVVEPSTTADTSSTTSTSAPSTTAAAAPPATNVVTTTPPPPTAPPDTTAPPQLNGAALSIFRISSRAPAGFGTCNDDITSTFSITATDNVGVASVSAAWVAPGGANRTTALSPSGNTWSGTVGPFPYAEIPEGDVVKYSITVTARDAAGNATVVPLPEFGAVESCPIVT